MTGPETIRAAEIVEEVARRLADPVEVSRVASTNTDRLLDGRQPLVWHAMSLNEGFLGVALLHSELGRREHAHAFLAAAAGAQARKHALIDGLPALLFATRAAAAQPGDYASLLGRAESIVRKIARQRAEAELSRLEPGRAGVAFSAYDVIEGLTGLGRVVLSYGDTEPLSYLIALTEPIEVAGTPVPGWLVSHAPLSGAPAGDGHFNLGLAHGIPGPLALLAVAYRRGFRLPGHEQAMERVAGWLLDWGDGGLWPPTVTLRQQLDRAGVRTHGHAEPETPDRTVPTAYSRTLPAASHFRPAWCYGTPGVARALFLAGQALDRPEWRQAAVRALHETLARPWDEWGMVDAGLCHGWAGMLHVTCRVGRESGDRALLAAADALAGRIVAEFAEDAPFGFRYSGTGGIEVAPDRVGLLEGAAGIALALHHYCGGEPPATGWDAALLLN
ncbi:lanthionine synthetase C family protein [Nonomuraea basaltis]|uniref:lanthionine synthetase C family protein n=1 Tax=Nonomuraea basaltis TaxID=2495887 RepID=UPI00110C521A|nr:lanthionine synthetase C family protein [Nonomuraea basaltis]TMR96553.1 lanthionine synthetase [Nonomuraea basaltis]